MTIRVRARHSLFEPVSPASPEGFGFSIACFSKRRTAADPFAVSLLFRPAQTAERTVPLNAEYCVGVALLDASPTSSIRGKKHENFGGRCANSPIK